MQSFGFEDVPRLKESLEPQLFFLNIAQASRCKVLEVLSPTEGFFYL